MNESEILPLGYGERTAVIKTLSAENKICWFVGFGVYDGQWVPPPMGKTASELNRLSTKSPRVKLDDGGIAWGFESWFIREERFKKLFVEEEKWKIINVDIEGKEK